LFNEGGSLTFAPSLTHFCSLRLSRIPLLGFILYFTSMATNDALWKGIIEDLMERNVPARKIRSLLNYIRFYTKLKDEELNEKFGKEVLRITGNKNIMGVEEILLEQAKDQGVKIGWKEGVKKGKKEGKEEGRLEQLYLTVKKLILKGKSNEYICNLLDVDEAFVEIIRKELTG